MILVGIDDTDIEGTEGTNQIARRIARRLPPGCVARAILRHQLLFDPRVPYTTGNGSASLLVEAPEAVADEVARAARAVLRGRFVAGSDPGLCVAPADAVPVEITAFGRLCQSSLTSAAEAFALAESAGLPLEALGGSGDGVIGALAAVGLLAAGDDGRVVELAGWPWPDPLAGRQPLAAIHRRGVADVRERETDTPIRDGTVDVGKHLRPAWRGGRPILYVEPAGPGAWRAMKLP